MRADLAETTPDGTSPPSAKAPPSEFTIFIYSPPDDDPTNPLQPTYLSPNAAPFVRRTDQPSLPLPGPPPSSVSEKADPFMEYFRILLQDPSTTQADLDILEQSLSPQTDAGSILEEHFQHTRGYVGSTKVRNAQL